MSEATTLPPISVVLPTYNAATWLPDTLAALRTALAEADWLDAEIVVVDDGSSDGTAELLAADTGVPALTVVSQANAGRFLAREAGLRAATSDRVLFIDSRVHAHPGSLAFLRSQLERSPELEVWNGHVHTASGASPFSRFWDAITFVAWRAYLKQPRLLTYGSDDYDRYPKGTTFFSAPRAWLLEAVENFDSKYADLRYANDDTLLIRPLAARSGITIAPEFSCTYFPRDSARKFMSHSFHRGTVFVDGYFRPGTRFHRPLQVLLAIAPIALFVAVRRPKLAVGATLAGSAALAVGTAAAGVPRRDAAALGALAPVFGVSYGAGIVRGLLLRCREAAR